MPARAGDSRLIVTVEDPAAAPAILAALAESRRSARGRLGAGASLWTGALLCRNPVTRCLSALCRGEEQRKGTGRAVPSPDVIVVVATVWTISPG